MLLVKAEGRCLSLASATSDFQRDSMLYYCPIASATTAANFPAMLRAPSSMDNPVDNRGANVKAWNNFVDLVKKNEVRTILIHTSI